MKNLKRNRWQLILIMYFYLIQYIKILSFLEIRIRLTFHFLKKLSSKSSMHFIFTVHLSYNQSLFQVLNSYTYSGHHTTQCRCSCGVGGEGKPRQWQTRPKVSRWLICFIYTHTRKLYATDGYEICHGTGRRTNQRKPGFEINFHLYYG